MKCSKHLLTPAKMSQTYPYNESSYRALPTPQIKARARRFQEKETYTRGSNNEDLEILQLSYSSYYLSPIHPPTLYLRLTLN